jgi:hypothetical protein
MLRDTLAALDQLPDALSRFRSNLPPRAAPTLTRLEPAVRDRLRLVDAYSMVPGRDPQIG